MPKFVNSSGNYYDSNKSKKDEDEILAALEEQNKSNDVKKPSAVNKKGTKEKQKSSLDLFKEELRRLNDEQEEQRNKVKDSLNSTQPTCSQQIPQAPIPIPLLPDPRCPTTLTLQVNLNPKDKDGTSGGSFDTGDPTTTNLYIGNLNPTVTENDLCDIFGRFGPLASIKIMWPRTDEERARNRNSGFVAYMSRIDGERALRILNGIEFRGYDMKLGWGKAVPLPKNPVFIPAELMKSLLPPPISGMPFNAQLHKDDIERGYKVPKPIPKPVPTESMSLMETDLSLIETNRKYEDFMEAFQRSTVQVCVPQDRSLLDRIHKTIEFVIREGPVFESIITARESANDDYKFLYHYESPEHVYYRWKLFSILHGDSPYLWRCEEFRMFEGGPLWRPPALNPFANGMQLELVERLTGINKDALTGASSVNQKLINLNEDMFISASDNAPSRSKLNLIDSKTLDDILKGLKPTKRSVGCAMLFCINHSYAGIEIIDRIKTYLLGTEATMVTQLAHLFLISDILNNSSATVTNASYYREGFKDKLQDIFEGLKDCLSKIENPENVKKLNRKILNVLGAWKYYQLYEDDFVLKLSNVLSGSSTKQTQETMTNLTGPTKAGVDSNPGVVDDDLDGVPIDDQTLAECLESKGLSLRWYKTLELSDDEEAGSYQSPQEESNISPKEASMNERTKSDQSVLIKERFKVSKWELVTESDISPTNVKDVVTGITKDSVNASKETD